MAKTDFKSVDTYIASRLEAVQGALKRVRSALDPATPTQTASNSHSTEVLMWILTTAVLALTIAQPFDQYRGQWTGEYHGTVFVRLILSESAGAAQGVMSIGESIHVNARGDVDGATEAPATPTRMLNLRWNGTVLSFSVEKGDDIHTFEFRPIDATTGELTPIIPAEQRQELADDGIALPKPFRVTKAR